MYAIKWIVGLVLALALPCLGASQANYPAYSTTAHTIAYGVSVATTEAASYYTVGTSGDPGSECLGIHLDPLNLAPGTYTVTQWKFATLRTAADDCDGAWVAVYSLDGTTYTREWYYDGYASLTKADNTAFTVQTFAPNTTLTIESGKTYLAGIVLKQTAATADAFPCWWRMKAAEGPQLSTYWRNNVSLIGTIPSTIAGATIVPTSTTAVCAIQQITLTTRVRSIYTKPTAYSGAALKCMVPLMGAADYWIMLRNVVVADGEALTVNLCDQAVGLESIKQTLVLDMGAADQVTWGGDNVALNAVAAEAGNTFDVGINLRPVANEADVFWVNKSVGQGAQTHVDSYYRDIATFSHAAKEAGGSRHAAAEANTVEPTYISLSGTATVGMIEVAYQPIVLCGDSQMGTKNDAATAAAYTRLGSKLPTAFTEDRCYWLAAIAGNKLCADIANSSTALSSRFKHSTAGLGDLCEMTGVVFVFQIGVNDIVSLVSAEAKRNPTVTDMLVEMSEILEDIAGRAETYSSPGSHALIVGLPRCWRTAAADDAERLLEDTTVKQWNYGLCGLSWAGRCSFYDSYTLGLSVLDTDYLHYATAGATAVAARIASNYESGRQRRAGGTGNITWGN